eukprot:CAMPEP_0177157562 /NCGR_PEP_ID=MMETSP0367-20130122/3329_1 /TAXON_ID=447022 ORGANISM="Scrippsiella hangoei-like, Strain SHHI-4" /NCGR_SAMPLE_ID=MMETSP0367 /ASSEMBLY_ACC=CAM_ASM_000362 /LENGTH=153 /DNA_ID=CAMNT_0018603097 /DNA_START=57 /DNA_END=518 /DNA_ORIENTATION=+
MEAHGKRQLAVSFEIGSEEVAPLQAQVVLAMLRGMLEQDDTIGAEATVPASQSFLRVVGVIQSIGIYEVHSREPLWLDLMEVLLDGVGKPRRCVRDIGANDRAGLPTQSLLEPSLLVPLPDAMADAKMVHEVHVLRQPISKGTDLPVLDALPI